MRKVKGLDLGGEPLGIKKNIVEYPRPPPPPPPFSPLYNRIEWNNSLFKLGKIHQEYKIKV